MPPESSSETEVEASASTETQNTDVTAAEESSTSGEGVEKASVLESVEAALGQGSEASPASEDGKEKETSGTDESGDGAKEGDGKLPELSEEEINSYPPNSQRRIRELVAERNDAQQKVDDLEALRPRAEQMDRITTYMRDNNIEPSEVDNALAITALINGGDYAKALETLTPIYREIAEKAGEILPDDLKEDVRLGRITEERARELNRARAKDQATTEQTERDRERNEAAEHERQVTEQVNTAATSVDEWAKGKAGSDPDWSLKQQLVADEIELVLRRGGWDNYPKNKQEAIQVAEKALETVEGRLKTLKPKPEQHRAPTGQFASPHAKSKPKTVMDAVDQALAD